MATYTVRPGDTLGKIAKKFYGDARRFTLIVSANSIANPDKLTVGEELAIPNVPAVAGGEPAPAETPASTVTGAVAAASPTAKLNEQRRKAALLDRLFNELLESIFIHSGNLGTGIILLLAALSIACARLSLAPGWRFWVPTGIAILGVVALMVWVRRLRSFR